MGSSQVTVGSGDHHVLALHGWFGSARGWGSLPDYLDTSAYTYVFMDLRGYGGRAGVAGEYTMEEAAVDAVALADELGWDFSHVVQHSLDNSDVEAFGAYLQSWARSDFADRVQGNPAAVKVIVGEHDPALSAEVMLQTYLVSYPNAELEVFPNAGHYPMYETPAALAASIEEFLGRD